MSERSIRNAIRKYLLSLPECYVRAIPGSPLLAGMPDLVGCLRGRMLAIETKRPGCKPTPLQAAELERWRAAGAIAAVVTSVEEVEELI